MRARLVALSFAAILTLDSSAKAESSGWQYTLGLPIWLPGISGEVSTSTAANQPVNVSISDILSKLSFGVALHAEAQKSRFGLGFDLLYLHADDAIDTGRVLPALKTVDLDIRAALAEAFAFYRVLHAGDERNPAALDLLGGTRAYSASLSLNDQSQGNSWFDLMLGVRGQYGFANDWSVRGRSDIAFLGSVLTLNLVGEVAWMVSEHWTVSAGYRAIDIDYEDRANQKVVNLNVHGPLLGVTASW